ncbi:MAG: hypothetical protein CM1200mP41_25250 [Gammaproteobacteria bacterium]|nr:MAG: hypothetical protein CM1200mP41_25250 [Gammaproteobacteria bacterium]
MTQVDTAQDLNAVSQQLTQTLTLQLPPIAVTVTAEPPDGVAAFDGVAAAGCQFWDIASKGPVVTSTPDHELCAVGIHTLQMEAPSDTCTQEIGEVLSVLGDLGYVRESDVARIPIMPRPSTHVVYAPLSNAPVAPDVVMLFADARHSLVITEAVKANRRGPATGARSTGLRGDSAGHQLWARCFIPRLLWCASLPRRPARRSRDLGHSR